MDEISNLIAAGGSPFGLGWVFTREVRQQIAAITENAVAEAQRGGMSEGEAVVKTIIGLYAHAFFVGRDHALAGLALPASMRRGVAGLTAESLSGIVIPDDLRSM